MFVRQLMGTVALMALAAAAHASPTFNFNTGAQGVTAGTGGVVQWRSSGGIGNTGYIDVTDYTPGETYLIAPVSGNLSSLLGGTLSFSYNSTGQRRTNAYVPYDAFGTVRIYSGASFVEADLIAPIVSDIMGTGWHTTSAYSLLDSAWTGSGLLSSILANVTMVTIVSEYNNTVVWPDEIIGFDNIAFAPSATTVPEPASGALLIAGLLGAGLVARRKRR